MDVVSNNASTNRKANYWSHQRSDPYLLLSRGLPWHESLEKWRHCQIESLRESGYVIRKETSFIPYNIYTCTT